MLWEREGGRGLLVGCAVRDRESAAFIWGYDPKYIDKVRATDSSILCH